jgi:hypothetical protein
VAEVVAGGHVIDQSTCELIYEGDDVVLCRDGQVHATFPAGWRLVLDRAGDVRAAVGMSARTVSGRLVTSDHTLDLALARQRTGRVDLDTRDGVTAPTGVALVPATT